MLLCYYRCFLVARVSSLIMFLFRCSAPESASLQPERLHEPICFLFKLKWFPFPDLCCCFADENAAKINCEKLINKKKKKKSPRRMRFPSYPRHLCCWGSLAPWRRGWSPAVGEAGGCDRESSRTALMPGSWTPMPSRSPSPSPRVSDSASCDYRGSGTCEGRREQIPLGENDGGGVSRQMEGQVRMVGGGE